VEGKIAFTACGKTQDLEAGQLLYLPIGELHSLRGIENGSLLVTILLPSQ
jgi:quercetin dioxygenase-like cupin family protein